MRSNSLSAETWASFLGDLQKEGLRKNTHLEITRDAVTDKVHQHHDHHDNPIPLFLTRNNRHRLLPLTPL